MRQDEKSLKKVLTEQRVHANINELSQTRHRENELEAIKQKIKLKKLLTNSERCDNLNKLSQTTTKNIDN